MIFVIDDDATMAECIGRAAKQPYQTFRDGITTMNAIATDEIPTLIFLDVLLDGPDGFTFLNELVSYDDTARIPVILVSSLDLTHRDLVAYNIVATLNKDTMTPSEIYQLAHQFSFASQSQPALSEPTASDPKRHAMANSTTRSVTHPATHCIARSTVASSPEKLHARPE